MGQSASLSSSLRGASDRASQGRGLLSYAGLSQASVRFGQPVFFSTYSAAAFSKSGCTLSFIGSIQSETFTHFAPSPGVFSDYPA
jgi:hypothetical protein